MTKLLRKINQSKWRKGDAGRVSADALTNCLKTSSNTLSVWRATDDDEGISNALIAMAGSFGNIETVDYVILDENEIANAGITIIESNGDTYAKTLSNLHRDLSGLHYEEMGVVSRKILDAISSDKTCIRLTKSEVVQIYRTAIENGHMTRQDIPTELLIKIYPDQK